MRLKGFGLVAFGLVLGMASPGRADEATDLKAVIAKAIEAQGGEANITKYKAASFKAKGTVQAQGMSVDYTGEFVSQRPHQSRATMDISVMGQAIKLVIVVNGDKGWLKIMDNTMDMDKDQLARQKEEQYRNQVGTLVPILKDKGFTLASLGDVKVDKTPAIGIKVSHKGHPDIDLFFDKKTNLLIKSASRVQDDTGQEVNQESFYSDFKEANGLKFPAKMLVKRDGKDYITGEVTDYKHLEKLDDSEFAKP